MTLRIERECVRGEAIRPMMPVCEHGNEGLCAGPMGHLGIVPIIAADEARLELLRPLAARIAQLSAKRIVLVRFTGRVDIEAMGAGHG